MENSLKIIDVIGKNSAVLHSDGLKVYDSIVQLYNSSKKLSISFEGLTHCTSAFLNASIGKFLLVSENKDEILKNLTYTHQTEEIKKKLDQVVEIATDEKKRIRHDELMAEEIAD